MVETDGKDGSKAACKLARTFILNAKEQQLRSQGFISKKQDFAYQTVTLLIQRCLGDLDAVRKTELLIYQKFSGFNLNEVLGIKFEKPLSDDGETKRTVPSVREQLIKEVQEVPFDRMTQLTVLYDQMFGIDRYENLYESKRKPKSIQISQVQALKLSQLYKQFDAEESKFNFEELKRDGHIAALVTSIEGALADRVPRFVKLVSRSPKDVLSGKFAEEFQEISRRQAGFDPTRLLQVTSSEQVLYLLTVPKNRVFFYKHSNARRTEFLTIA